MPLCATKNLLEASTHVRTMLSPSLQSLQSIPCQSRHYQGHMILRTSHLHDLQINLTAGYLRLKLWPSEFETCGNTRLLVSL
jgi:hypothetical protein